MDVFLANYLSDYLDNFGLISPFDDIKVYLKNFIIAYDEIYNLPKVRKYERYKASLRGTPIFNREAVDFMKVNNKINNSFMSEVVDTKQGYMVGMPVTYSAKRYLLPYNDTPDHEIELENKKYTDMSNLVTTFCRKNNIHDLNMETIKMMAIMGNASRLLYIDENAEARVMNIDASECIFIYNNTKTSLDIAIRYYWKRSHSLDAETGKLTLSKDLVFEVYTKDEIYTYKSDSMDFMTEVTLVSRMPHLFGRVPLFEFINNDERQGDCDKALATIDAYDRSLSDLSSELEQFRLAYLALYGLKAEKGDLEKMAQTGAFEMTKDGRVEFITKKIDIASALKFLDRLENNIIRFTKSVNFKDETFYGNLSGAAVKYKLMQLEEKASVAQVKFEHADDYMWQALASIYNLLGKELDPLAVQRRFVRNIPVNTLEEARIQNNLKGALSTGTRLELAPFISDPEAELRKLQEEAEKAKKTGINLLGSDFYDNITEEEIIKTGNKGTQEVTPIRQVDVESGGLVDRNTHGPLDDLKK